ncbi:glycosyltransferase family 2 protein [Aureimonas sp. Leaf324]|uniref:glycosyltransferase family 2 protein n=1 Tax=Aureimonas sp. Leaf324 TaxID=1736336 RepID=UPI000700FFFC|nr:glycosyltransferase family 2 protein [Aureimonas sp. Leaf324]KQQ85984.1 bactoprenol glucosyl transferase [Aureimonas sp. Leaf324]
MPKDSNEIDLETWAEPDLSSAPLVSLVVPCFNEAEVLPIFLARMRPILRDLSGLRHEIVFVNDGSTDGTLPFLIAETVLDPAIRVVDLSRNFGKEAALSAGLAEARGDAVIPFDADLQDPPDLIPRLVERWREGFEVVIARRVDRSCDGFLKRETANAFYRLHGRMTDIDLPENAGDFRLMDRRVVDALNAMPESCRFMKGLFAWAGFRTASVDYVRQPRAAGRSKFSGWKLWNFALEGITSFSTLPLRIWTYAGFLVAAGALVYALAVAVRTLAFGVDVPGYASLAVLILLFGGLQMIGMGMIGEYVGRIYMESKRRPLYFVRARFGGEPTGERS